MRAIAVLSDGKRKELFDATAAQKGISASAAEKDFWVCWVLQQLFTHHRLKDVLMFKGGTSLSKVFNVIERFSEDIDLILDWRELTSESPLKERSKTQQDKFNKELLRKTEEYVMSQMLPLINESVGAFCDVRIDDIEKTTVHVKYSGVLKDRYLREEILLEIGPLAEWLPSAEYSITSYAAEAFPNLFVSPDAFVKTVKAERTFWEKVTILHKEAFRSDESLPPARYSRHYYDLAQMSRSAIKNVALGNIDLLRKVVVFKEKFYPSTWARYEDAKPGTIRLVPPPHVQKILKDDYRAMRNMIFGVYPSFEEIMGTLRTLEKEINLLK